MTKVLIADKGKSFNGVFILSRKEEKAVRKQKKRKVMGAIYITNQL